MEIPGGTFSMGSREGRECEQSRDVTVEPFLMLDHEVTGEEYAECAGTSSSKKKRPAASVSYSEAVGYCEWLSQECGRRVRLPTEEEWERAARGGIRKARYPWGWNPPEGRACFDVSEAADVRSYDANPYGLYDMSGSVFEWCASSDVSNAIARGGAWSERQPEMLTVFRRTKFPKDYADADVGFRVVVEIENNLPTP
ncbi:MAG: formylglycine-generating enzyme family protein [Verrucomicrobia bacterium]|nr:formylglycine-generating enzyme family protein [Verrucomicrobiota bacterium]